MKARCTRHNNRSKYAVNSNSSEKLRNLAWIFPTSVAVNIIKQFLLYY